MYIDHLSLMNFRTYPLLNLPLEPGVTVFLGSNGVGKTNIVEAVDFTAQLGSHRVSQDAPLVRVGNEKAYVRARINRGELQTVLEFEVAPGKSNRVRINRAAPVRARDALGIVKTVLFSPEDLALVKGDPATRRRFIDEVAVALRPAVAGYRSDYERILRQRNSLLKSLRGGKYSSNDEYTLEVFSEKLASAGALLAQARLRTLALLLPQVQQAYGLLTDGAKNVTAGYESGYLPRVSDTVLPQASLMNQEDLYRALMAAMKERRSDELERGMSLVGPHRDDLLIELGGIPAKGFASHGETWSLALALRLGAWFVLRADDEAVGAEPILILDDVFAELDSARRHRLGALVAEAEQVLVTCAVRTDIPEELGNYRVVAVSPGAAVYEEPDE